MVAKVKDAVAVFDPDLNVWERQPEETDKQYRAFRTYKMFPPAKRSVVAVYRELGDMSEGAEVNYGNAAFLYQWASLWNWKDRAAAFDRYQEKIIEEELISRRMQARLEAANIGREMREKAYEAVKQLQAIVFEEDVDGEVVPKSALTPSEIARLAQIGTDLERQALEIGEGSGRPSVAVQINFNEMREEARRILDQQDEVVDVTSKLLSDAE